MFDHECIYKEYASREIKDVVMHGEHRKCDGVKRHIGSKVVVEELGHSFEHDYIVYTNGPKGNHYDALYIESMKGELIRDDDKFTNENKWHYMKIC